jgi:type I restriction-modification system DNA methylase subunit
MDKELVAGNLNQLRNLVSLFSANIAQYKGGQYDEANTRTDFIDKFFILLDWDIANNQGFSESYREVVREDKVKIDGSKKAPDYSFRIGGVRKFFVEAKKPNVNIKEATEPAYQVRRYAYTAKLPLSILTNFAEFAVYDTRIKPNKNDKAGTARIFYCTFNEYEQHFEFINGIFSKDAILKGSFDKYIEENKNKKGTSEVDTEILALVEEWRIELAKNIAKNNPDLSIYDLNTVVQRIIDRIIFLRIAEDKGIEDENLLLSVTKNQNIYEKLIHLFTKANIKYNSGLFIGVDWINRVSIEDKVLSHIIVNLYYPECPYEFSVLPVEILGSIYERFLGKTIRFRTFKGDTHTAIIEEKPEIKKAGGVYYTPQYIVDYIVQNTVGEKIRNKTPQEISGIKVCDPACGSGSFLVGAYQYLLDYHLDYYTQTKNLKAALKAEKIYEAAFQSYRLTISEKQRILENSIFGVDIDEQAVEVTKLSLYLKLLENESGESTGELFKYSDMTLLLSLEDNIKCGNSLIGTDFYVQPNLELTNDDQIKVNCFDWGGKDGFEEIFKNGGFDVVIGNPPYFNIQTLGAGSKIAQYIQKKYADIWQDKSDILFYFLVKAMQLSKGNIGFILSNAFLFSDKAQKLRNKIIDDDRLARIVNFEQFQVFEGASITTGIFIFQSDHSGIQATTLKNKTYSVKELQEYINNRAKYFKVKFEKDAVFALSDSRTAKMNKKIDGNHPLLQDICLVGKGMETAADDVFLFTKYPKQFPKKFMKRRITGKDIDRYFINDVGDYVLYFEDVENFKDLPISIQNHLNDNKKLLKGRATVKNEGRIWWRYSRPMHKEYYHLPKLYCSRRSFKNTFCYDDGFDCLGFSNMTVIFGTNDKLSLKYILALLNSKLLSYRYKSIGKQTGGGSFEYFPNGVGKLPIPPIDLSIKDDKAKHDNFVTLVDKMLELKQKEAAEKNQQLKTMIIRQIEGVDKAIDTAVYGLYNLTEDEIRIVEG